jgi:hypothetical protein
LHCAVSSSLSLRVRVPASTVPLSVTVTVTLLLRLVMFARHLIRRSLRSYEALKASVSSMSSPSSVASTPPQTVNQCAQSHSTTPRSGPASDPGPYIATSHRTECTDRPKLAYRKLGNTGLTVSRLGLGGTALVC